MLRQAWPIVLANASVPLLGLADTAIIGRTGSITDLGAIALGALIFNLVFWGFGFLRMGTTGFVAMAAGAGNEEEVRAATGRALLLASSLGVCLVLLQWPVIELALSLLRASPAVEQTTRAYFNARIWGAPASLCTFAIMGCFVGLGQGRLLLAVQVVSNGVNIALDFYFSGVLGWGAWGIALGTALSQWAGCMFALHLVIRLLKSRQHPQDNTAPLWPIARILNREQLRKTLTANADILVRTITLLLAFSIFTNQAAQFGDAVLGANHILLQLVSFSAYFLDGYAFVAESLVGQAMGAQRTDLLDVAVTRSTQLAAITACTLGLGLLWPGHFFVALLAQHPHVVELAQQYLPFAAAYVVLSFPAFQLDGIFIGTGRTRAMRNAALLAVAIFLCSDYLLRAFGYAGLWLAFIVYVISRALCLAAYYPRLRQAVGSQNRTSLNS